jgi:putative endonuclease
MTSFWFLVKLYLSSLRKQGSSHEVDMERKYYVYILASKRHGTLYAGFSGSFETRKLQHFIGKGSKFVEKYKVNKLVYYEIHNEVTAAYTREKQIKKWKRQWKIDLIEKFNPEWEDLFKTLTD